MPLLEPATGGDDLVQGDLLSGVSLFGGDLVKGAGYRINGRSHCLVVSRDCVAVRDPQVVVAAVKQFNPTPPVDAEADEEDVRHFFEDFREGIIEPDTFYLGSIPGGPERFAARLDELCTVKLPSADAERSKWIAEHRVARLTPDFVRALPVRLFMTFGRVGYNDHTWYCTQDLEWLVKKGRASIAKSKADLAVAEADLAQTQLSAPANSGRLEADGTKIRGLRGAVQKAEAKLAPFEAELTSRADT
jgi:hypothetical protein